MCHEKEAPQYKIQNLQNAHGGKQFSPMVCTGAAFDMGDIGTQFQGQLCGGACQPQQSRADVKEDASIKTDAAAQDECDEFCPQEGFQEGLHMDIPPFGGMMAGADLHRGGMHPPFLFFLKKRNGPCTVQRETA